jgi:hypothetical protein
LAGSGADARGNNTAGAPLAKIAAITGNGGPGETSVPRRAGNPEPPDPAAPTGPAPAPAGTDAGAGTTGGDTNGCTPTAAGALAAAGESGCAADAAGAVLLP